MNRRSTLLMGLASAAALLLPLGAQAQSAGEILATVSARLSAIRTLQSDFVQLNADGSRSTGTLSVSRPGRMRMDYQGSNPPLVIVGGGQVAIYDGPRKTSPEVYPLQSTPLWLILRPDVNLSTGQGVRRAWAEGQHLYVNTYDPNRPEAGQITFQFAGSPLMLQGWISQTQGGEKVTVALQNVRQGMNLGDSLFSPSVENGRRGQR